MKGIAHKNHQVILEQEVEVKVKVKEKDQQMIEYGIKKGWDISDPNTNSNNVEIIQPLPKSIEFDRKTKQIVEIWNVASVST